MEMDMAKMHTSQQDTELIDILWRQDVDLGAGREVFDFSYRQKEVELRRRREQEEEELQRRLREREKALLAQLQLDEETGEFVPRSEPAASQNGAFPLEAGDTMSFDECMQLLAETFPLEEPSQSAPPPLDPASDLMTPVSTRSPPAPLDLAWMELLSLPELQCLALPMQENLDALFNPSPPADTPEPNFRQFLSDVDPLSSSHLEVCPPEYISSYSGSFSSTASPSLSQMSLNGPSMAPDFIAEEFGQLFYPEAETPVETTDRPGSTMDLRSFSPGNPELGAEFPDSDSGLSLDASSPGKSLQGNESAGFSDSDSEDTGSPGSAESDCAEMFPLVCFTEGSFTSLAENESPEPRLTNPKFEPVEAGGHSKPPFTKDKQKKRSEARLSRDEQRAKALRIPFTVDMIINLPVDDFNEMMSKHQLNEAQLALVRDIRRRGKNKVAAQNCRKRKLENIVGLEYELDSLKEEKERLTEEKSRRAAGLKEMKHQLSALYQEVFSRLRDERGKPFSPDQYSLQHTADGAVFLVPRLKKAALKSD